MAKKQIPKAFREYIEKQIVRGSRGYETMVKLLKHNSEEDLRWFLEFYETNIRDGLVDETTGSSLSDGALSDSMVKLASDDDAKNAAQEGLLGSSVGQIVKQDQDKESRSGLLAHISKEEDDDDGPGLLGLVKDLK